MFPKTGNNLHAAGGALDLASMIAGALTAELGSSHRAVKTAMRWTGASERTVKHWLAATHAPQGTHLVALARHSDHVLAAFLTAAHREEFRIGVELQALRTKLVELVSLLENH